jgi:hypothetical protein
MGFVQQSPAHGLYYLSYRLYIGDGEIVDGSWNTAPENSMEDKNNSTIPTLKSD